MLTEIALAKRVRRSTSTASAKPVTEGKYKCPYCPSYFGKVPSFSTYDEFLNHHNLKHPAIIPEDKRTDEYRNRKSKHDERLHEIDAPETRPTYELKQFEVWYRLLKSKHPHFEFVKVHRSKWSNYTPQYVLRDTRNPGRLIVLTLEQLRRRAEERFVEFRKSEDIEETEE